MLENFNDFKFILLGETNVQEREDPVSAFAKVKTKLKQADLLFGHMEGLLYPPTINSDVNDLPFKEGWKHSEPGMVNAFIDAGFDVVSNASNVAYGSEAIESTIETLEKSGIKYCGIGRNIEEAKSPAIVEKRGLKFGFLSYTSVFWPTGMEAASARAGVSTISAKTYYQPHKRTIEMPEVPPIVRTEPDSKQLKAMEDSIKKL
ncbi:MAG: CapA family protein, partial [Halanaerobiales bacterium]